MTDREKVIKGFECCHVMVHDLGPDKASCEICPYKDVQTEEQIDLGGIECIAVLHDDALALLKEQETELEHLWDAPDLTFKGRCKKCGFVHLFIEGHDAQYKFCPQCGQKVKLE
jgi:hypothetical protein